MKFEDMVPLVRELTEKREAKERAETAMRFHQHNSPPGHLQIAEENYEAAKEEWWQCWQKVERSWDEVLKPLGLTRQDLRMAAL